MKIFFSELKRRYELVDVSGIAAEAAYYLILSIFPFFISLLNLIQYSPLKDKGVTERALELIPEQISDIISSVLVDLLDGSSPLLLWISIFLGIFSASKGIGAIIKGINKSFLVEEDRGLIKNKAYAFAVTFLFIFIIIISITGLVFGDVIVNRLFLKFDIPIEAKKIVDLLKYALIGGILALSFTQLYYISPNLARKDKPTVKHAFLGGLFATIFWIVISNGFSFYINNFASYSKTYGSLGGIIALIVWLNLTANVIIVGGIITGVLKDGEGKTDK
ncbi:MAG: YihY/virulence factor BrkB family protein [Tissierellia bacterium]|nr:YihY/virulence factor BrkB family protein [Tissierellia bacterium]